MTTTDEPPISIEEFNRIFQTKSDDLRAWRESLHQQYVAEQDEPDPDPVVVVTTTAPEFAAAVKEAYVAGWDAACRTVADYLAEDDQNYRQHLHVQDMIGHPEMAREAPTDKTA